VRGARLLLIPALACVLAGAVTTVRGQRAPGASVVRFTDITTAAGLDLRHVNGASPDKHLVETMGSGAVLLDFDNDGWLDLFAVDGGSLADPDVARRARHRLFRNRGGGSFVDLTASSGIEHHGYGMGACAGDYDNDGWIDLYVTAAGPNRLFRNRRGTTFEDVTNAAGVGLPSWTTSCAFADFDRDGDLDLFVTNYVDASAQRAPFCGNAELKLRIYCHPLNYEPLPNVLYRNTGKGRFVDASADAGIATLRSNGLGVVVADFDDDQWPDVFVANDTMPNFLFFNERGERFREGALLAGVAVAIDGVARAGMGADAGDYDGDARLDLIVTNLDLETHSVFRNLGARLFAYTTRETGLSGPTRPFVGFGVSWMDYDNDGASDVAIANGHVMDNAERLRSGARHAQRPQLFRNVNGRFVETGRTAGEVFERERVRRGLATGDIDNDGDLDLVLTTNGGQLELLRNDGGNAQNALLLRTIGTTSNRDGIGARLTITAGRRTQVREIRSGSGYLSQNDVRAHVGLGRATLADRVEVRWPSGRTDVVTRLRANQAVALREGQGVASAVPLAR
jgi:hypothetical protein